MEAARKPEHKVIITGTGRCGTTFLVRLLGALGLDTGINEGNWNKKYFEHCKAGLEHDILDRKTPYIIKNPALCDTLGRALATGRFVIDHAYVPIRDLESVAASRAAVGGADGSTPGGLWRTADPAAQGAVMGEMFHALVHTLVANEIPHTFIMFPRMVRDPAYTYRKLEFLMGSGTTYETFLGAFKRTADPSLVHAYPPVQESEQRGPQAQQPVPARRLPLGFDRLLPSWVRPR
jgi:hypothetical protein